MPAVTELTLGGTGEPSLSPALPLLCELGKRYEVCSRVITNGAALVNPRAGLDNAGVVTVSFDGAAKRTFEAIRVGTSFETLLDRIARFRQRNPKTTIILNAAVCRANIDEIYGMAKWAVRLKANGLGLNKLFPYMDHLKPLELRRSDAPLLRRQLRKARKLCSRHGIDLMNSVHLGDAPADDGPIDKERLLAGLESVAVVRGMKTPDLEASCAAAEGHDWQYLPASVAEFDRPEEPVAGPATCRPAAGDRPGGAWDVDALECRLGELTERLKQTPPEDIRIPFCLSPWVKMRIVATSRITPCCVWPGHFEDLKEFETAREAWHSEAYVALRQQTLEPERMPEHCRTCSFVERLPDPARSALLPGPVRRLAGDSVAREFLSSRDGQGSPVGCAGQCGPGDPGLAAPRHVRWREVQSAGQRVRGAVGSMQANRAGHDHRLGGPATEDRRRPGERARYGGDSRGAVWHGRRVPHSPGQREDRPAVARRGVFGQAAVVDGRGGMDRSVGAAASAAGEARPTGLAERQGEGGRQARVIHDGGWCHPLWK